MEFSVQQYLDSVSNPRTKKGYRKGINEFCKWFNKPAEEILQMRKDDLTQRDREDLIEYKNRASRFEKEIEKFHANLLQTHPINTARNYTLGIRQLFRYYEMPIRFRTGSKVSKTVKTTRNFPLTIEHVRKMYDVADLRERIILSMATDLGLRIGDFISIKKKDLPSLDQEPPISFEIMTDKEDVVAHGFLSQESTELLKIYLPTLEKKKSNPYLFPSNGKSHISDEWMNRLLQRLINKAQIDLNGKKLTFHCFRKMFMSASIDSGIGLTAGKKLCGKAIAQSDDTYLTTVNLRKKFIQLKKFLTIREQPKIDFFKQLVFDDYEDVPEHLRPIRSEFTPYIGLQLKKIAKTMGITEKEVLKRITSDDVEAMKKADANWAEIEKRLKLKQAESSERSKKNRIPRNKRRVTR
jgi:integrase